MTIRYEAKDEILSKLKENVITGFVYFNDNTLVGQIRSEEDRRLIRLGDIPPLVIDALLAIEETISIPTTVSTSKA